MKDSIVPSEKTMVEIYLSNEKKNSGKKRIIAQEIQNYQKKIDMAEIPIYSKNRYGSVHSIEFKVLNWQNCYRQSLRNRIFFPFNSIAIWDHIAERVKKDLLIVEGIGLIKVSRDKNIQLIKPKKSPFVDANLYKKLRKKILKQNIKV